MHKPPHTPRSYAHINPNLLTTRPRLAPESVRRTRVSAPRWLQLAGTSRCFRPGPGLQVARFDAEAREDGADLLAVYVAVMQGLDDRYACLGFVGAVVERQFVSDR